MKNYFIGFDKEKVECHKKYYITVQFVLKYDIAKASGIVQGQGPYQHLGPFCLLSPKAPCHT